MYEQRAVSETGGDFLLFFKLGEGGEEAAWIMRQGRTGRWETNVCLISQ